MIGFSRLFRALDWTNRTNEKLEELHQYFASADPGDAAWALYFLTGGRLKRLVKPSRLRRWAAEETSTPDWLLEECYALVGDAAETIALLLPAAPAPWEESLRRCVEEHLLPLEKMDEERQRAKLVNLWARMDSSQILLLNKLITGGFRVGVSNRLVTRALARLSGVDSSVIAHGLMGDWKPSATFFRELVSKTKVGLRDSQPYPFYLASPLDLRPQALGPINDWQIEWKWDGIRAQLIRRAGATFIWSRGEELITDRFPELVESSGALEEGCVIDGEIVPWKERALPFSLLQRRIGRKKLSRRVLTEVPVTLLAFDLLESGGEDVRGLPLEIRRSRLADLFAPGDAAGCLRLAPVLECSGWEHLAGLRSESRQRGVEGLMLKRKASSYGEGRRRGDWWKWKVEPFRLDAVLIYAQRGHGVRAGLYTDYTFALWDGGRLVPFAKAYSGLSNEEIRQVDRFVRESAGERYGPVRSVPPELVFEIAFEGIQRSGRHRSGLAVRFPRIARWRLDKRAEEADNLEALRALLPEEDCESGR